MSLGVFCSLKMHKIQAGGFSIFDHYFTQWCNYRTVT